MKGPRLCRQRKTKLRKPNIAATKVSSFKRDLYKLMFDTYKKKHHLKPCVILLGNVKNLNTDEFAPSKKLQRYLHKLNRSSSINTTSSVRDRTSKISRQKTVRLEVSVSGSNSRKSSEHKNSAKVFAKCNPKTRKPIFEKNFVISDDSESDNENNGAVDNSKRGFSNKVAETNEPNHTKVNCKSNIVTKIYDEKENITDKLVKITDNDCDNVTNNSSKQGMSIIQLAFEKAFIETVDVVDRNNKNEENAMTTPVQEEEQVVCTQTPVVEQKLMHIFGKTFVQEYACSECKETFDDCFKLKRHTMVHKMKSDKIEKKPTLSCYLCMRKFCDRNALWNHMRSHSLKHSKRTFTCKKCNMEFKSSRDLCAHQSVCTGSTKSSNKNVAPIGNSDIPSENNLKYRCSICKRKFADVLQMRKHKKLHNVQDVSTSDEHAVTTSSRTIVLLDKIVTTTANSKMSKGTTTSSSNSMEKIKSCVSTKQAPEKKLESQIEKKISENISQEKCPIRATSPESIQIPGNSRLIELKPTFKCCKRIFAERNEVFSHMKEQMNTAGGITNCNPLYICKVCSTEYVERLEWYQHCKTRHKNFYGQKTNKSTIKMRKPRYACGTCYMKFDSISKLKEHKLNIHSSINYLQKTSSREAKVQINDLRAEFERLFCATSVNQQHVINTNDANDQRIVVEDPSEVSEPESRKDNRGSPTNDDVEDGKIDSTAKLTDCSEDEKAHTNFELPVAPSVENTSIPVTYTCDICDDVFEDHDLLLEHEAFHREIEMPKKIQENKNADQRKSLDMPHLPENVCSNHGKGILDTKESSPALQPDMPINHINIAVNLPNMVNTTLDDALPQQNLVTIMIGNSAPSTISPFNTSGYVQSHNIEPKFNSFENVHEEPVKRDLNVQPLTHLSTSTNKSNNDADKSLIISDARCLGKLVQTLNQPAPTKTTGENNDKKTVVVNKVRSRTNSAPLRLAKVQFQDQNNQELQQFAKLSDNVNKAVFPVLMSELHTNQVVDNASMKTLATGSQTQELSQSAEIAECSSNVDEVLGQKPVGNTGKIFLTQVSSKAPKNTITTSLPKTVSLLTFTVPELTKQVTTTTISQATSENRPLENANQLMLVNQAINLNQSASSHMINSAVGTNSYCTVISPQGNNANLVSHFPQLAAALTQTDNNQQISAATSNSATAVKSKLPVGSKQQVKLVPIGSRPGLPRTYKNNNKEKLLRSKEKLKKWFAGSSFLKISPKPSENDVIVLSDDSDDSSSSGQQKGSKEIERASVIINKISLFGALPTMKDETPLEIDKETEPQTVLNTVQNEEEALVTANQTIGVIVNDGNPLLTEDIQVAISNPRNKVTSDSPSNPNLPTACDSWLNVACTTHEKSETQVPRIFVRNIKDLMEPQLKPSEQEAENVDQSGISTDGLENSDSLPASEGGSVLEQNLLEKSSKNKKSKFEPMKCDDCKVCFKKRGSFQRHMKSRRYTYRCHLCDYHTCSRHCLKLHYSSDHKIEHVCLLCKSKCESKQNLYLHYQSHKCPQCCVIVVNIDEHLSICRKGIGEKAGEAPKKQTELVNRNKPDTEGALPVLREELSLLEDIAISSQDVLDCSDVPLVIDESSLL